MLKHIIKPICQLNFMRCFSLSGKHNKKVTVVGAGGGIGQPLSMLVKRNSMVSTLALYDVIDMTGIATDLSHIDTMSKVEGYCGPELGKALMCAHIVVMPAGVPRQPGMSREDLFDKNATTVANVAKEVAKYCPEALFAIITNPINSLVPVAAEVLKAAGVYDKNRLFGVTTLDLVRARAFLGHLMEIDPKTVKVDVVGGHSESTILPLISSADPPYKGSKEDIDKLTQRIRIAGTAVIEAKGGKGSATLSMAHSGYEFVNSLLRGLNSERNVVDYAYIDTDFCETGFFATKFELGPKGVKKILDLPAFTPYEVNLLNALLDILKADVQKGIDFVNDDGKDDCKK